MAPISIPETGISLHAAGGNAQDAGKHAGKSAILLRLNDALVEDMRVAAQNKRLHFDAGKAPKLRLGTKTIDLDLSPDAFRHELYTASSLTDFAFDALITHRARVKSAEKEDKGTAGADAALASLKNNLASFAQEKQANSTAISNSVQATPKNRYEAARTQKQTSRSLLSGTQSGGRSPSAGGVGTPRGLAPTSQPVSEDQAKLKAMRVAVIHLLAMKPATLEDISSKTRIRKEEMENVLRKVGQERDGKWELVNRSYKELDVWSCKYLSQEDRQAAIDNAIKAFDRLRLGKEDKVWQLLLPAEERGKGKVLSKLHLGASQSAAGNFTPGIGSSPQATAQGSQPGSSAGTPQLGAASKTAAAKKSSDITKRLLSKDPKKAREQEEAKMKKRKERDATASDVEGKKAARRETATVKGPPAKKIKSAEIVHSSEDEDEEAGEVKEKKTSPSKSAAKPAATKTTKTKSSSSDSSDVPVKQAKAVERPPVTKKRDAPAAKPEASPATKPAKPAPVPAGKTTPRTNGLSAPSNKSRPGLSPQKPDSRPHVPSPLGAARPRNASDVSDRSAIGVQRTKHGGGDKGTPKGLGISHGGVRKRQDTVTSATSSSSSGPEQRSTTESSQDKARKATKPSGTSDTPPTKPSTSKSDGDRVAKRKRADENTREDDTAIHQSESKKHRKTDSASSQGQDDSSSSTATGSSTAKTSPEVVFDSGSSDAANSSSAENAMSFRQAVSVAQNFKAYYPSYSELWEKLAAIQAKGEELPKAEVERLWVMQNRLAEMKRDIQEASRVGGG
ncbi:hypothetical protein MBLNU230_g8267t1 [Neophaeotheca triangularis]